MRRATNSTLGSSFSLQRLRLWAACSLLAALYSLPASAISIAQLAYDARKDQLVMNVVYRGSNPDHEFSVQWNECERLDDERSQILGLLIDSQPNDRALQDFTREFKVDLSTFTCRPSKVTIRTSAGFFMSVDVPLAPRKGSPTSPLSDARNAP